MMFDVQSHVETDPLKEAGGRLFSASTEWDPYFHSSLSGSARSVHDAQLLRFQIRKAIEPLEIEIGPVTTVWLKDTSE